MRARLLIFAACVAACGRVSENAPPDVTPIDGAPDTVVLETSSPDTKVVDGADADAEYCPSPMYPPRTDGCPCNPGAPRPCGPANKGAFCVYKPDCRGGTPASRYECRYVIKFEDSHWEWSNCSASCVTGECLSPWPDYADAGR